MLVCQRQDDSLLFSTLLTRARPPQQLTASVFAVTYDIYYHVKSSTAHSCVL